MIADYLTIAEAAHLIKTRQLSAVELLESRFERIQGLDDKLNSFIRVLANDALVSAQNLDKEISAGHYRGPLHGIPIGIKDVFDVAGVPTTAHSKILQNNVLPMMPIQLKN